MSGKYNFVAFTSANFAYFPKVAVLARSFKKHNPNGKFIFLLNERKNADAISSLDRTYVDEIIFPDDLNITKSVDQWYFSHNVVEFCTATKPFALQLLLDKYGVPVVYLDPDTRIYSSLADLAVFGPESSVKLTPHMLAPAVNSDEVIHHEISCLKHGVFNLGFICVNPSPEGFAFVRWWSDRLREYCFADFERGLFTDQRWVDLSVALFPFVEIIRDVGYNVASWNVSRRKLAKKGSELSVNQISPLRFFHFSGFDSKTHHKIIRLYAKGDEILHDLTSAYEQELAEFKTSRWDSEPWTYGTYEDGSKIEDYHRIYFRKFLEANGIENPFSEKSGKVFRRRTSYLAKARLREEMKNYLKVEKPGLFTFLAKINGFRRVLSLRPKT